MSTLDRVGRTAWVVVPRRVAGLSRGLAVSLADGHFANAFPRAGGLVPVVCILGGFVVGATTWGYERVFSESLALVMVAVLVGSFAAGAGAWLVAGFALGDFFIGDTTWIIDAGWDFPGGGLLGALVLYRVPMLIGYSLLVAGVVLMPMAARTLVAGIPHPRTMPRGLAAGVTLLLCVVLVVVGALLWSAATAVLVRPLFTWVGEEPTVDAVAVLQTSGAWVAAAAAFGIVVRTAVLLLVYTDPVKEGRLASVEQALAAPTKRGPALRTWPVPAAVVLAGWTTLMLAGTIQTIIVAVLVFVIALGIRLARTSSVPWLDTWRRITAQVPVLLRLGAGALLAVALQRAYLGDSNRIESFDQLALYTVVAALAMFALLPGNPTPRTQHEAVTPT